MNATPYWIKGPWSGRGLAILPRPRGGDWLGDEVRSWRAAGINIVVSTLTAVEVAELDLAAEAEECHANGIDFIAFPFMDRGTPASNAAAIELGRRLKRKVTAGKNIGFHCRQGVGRSALMAVTVAVVTGMPVDAAWDLVQVARGHPVPDTAEQKVWAMRMDC